MNVSLSFFVSVSVCVLHVFIFFCSVRCSTVHSLSLFCFIVNCHNRNKESHYCRKKMEKNRKKPFSTRFFSLSMYLSVCVCKRCSVEKYKYRQHPMDYNCFFFHTVVRIHWDFCNGVSHKGKVYACASMW